MRLIALALLVAATTFVTAGCVSSGKKSSLGTHKGYHPGQKSGNPVRDSFNTFRK